MKRTEKNRRNLLQKEEYERFDKLYNPNDIKFSMTFLDRIMSGQYQYITMRKINESIEYYYSTLPKDNYYIQIYYDGKKQITNVIDRYTNERIYWFDTDFHLNKV